MNIIPDSTSVRIKRYSRSDFYVTLFDCSFPCLASFKSTTNNLAELLSYFFETWSYDDAKYWLSHLIVGRSYNI